MVFGSLLAFRNATAGEVSNSNKNIRKNAGGNGVWNAGYESVETVPASTEGYVEFTCNLLDFAGGSTNYVFCGFSRASDTPIANFTSIRYALYTGIISVPPTLLYVFESGSSKITPLPVTTGDVLRVQRSAGGVITYYKNGSLIYTSLINDTNALKVDGTAFSVNHRILDITMDRGNGPFNPFYQNKVNVIEY